MQAFDDNPRARWELDERNRKTREHIAARLSMKRVLAFGDSLTAGYVEFGSAFNPYATRLSALLEVPVDHIGLSGWTVGQMLENADNAECIDVCDRTWSGLRKQLQAAKMEGRPYSHAIILGGTNDLGDCVQDKTSATLHRAIESLRALHSITQQEGCTSLACTVPEHPAEGAYLKVAEARTAINEALSSFEGTHVVDISACMPQKDSSLWDADKLHCSRKG